MSASKKFRSAQATSSNFSLSSDSDDNIFCTDTKHSPWLKRKARGESSSVSTPGRNGPPQMVVTPKMCRLYKTINDSDVTSPDSSRNFVDLSQDRGETLLLPGAPFNWLRKRHELFWTFDPRGHEKEKDLDCRYCEHCRCPEHYCAQVMYGDVCTNHVVYLIVELGGDATLSELYITETFRQTYTRLVQCKMMENGVSFPGGFDFKESMDLPVCLVEGSVNALLKEYE